MNELVNTTLSEPGGRKSRRGALTTVVLGLAAFAIGAVAMLAYQATREDDDPGLFFEIPAGASASVPAGLISAVDMPRDIVFKDGDTAKITVVNHDNVTHLAGPFVVAPGETFVQTFPNPGIFPINCAVNADESIVVKVE